MDAEQERLEVEHALLRDHDLAVEHALLGQLLAQRRFELDEIAIERLELAALDVDRVSVLEHERAEAVPLGLVEPLRARRDVGRELGEHRLDRRSQHARDASTGSLSS
jgi:hypothetical protein